MYLGKKRARLFDRQANACRDKVRGKVGHNLPTADGELLLIKRIKTLPPFLSYVNQIK